MTSRVQVTWRYPGGRQPADVTYIGRPSPWGNPYPVADHGRTEAVALFAQYALTRAVREPSWLVPLIGQRLACYCPPDQLCHGDVLAELLTLLHDVNQLTPR